MLLEVVKRILICLVEYKIEMCLDRDALLSIVKPRILVSDEKDNIVSLIFKFCKNETKVLVKTV